MPTRTLRGEIVALYHERWELELGYDEVKTEMLDREEAIRSRTVEAVTQELWGIFLAYNIIRHEIEDISTEANEHYAFYEYRLFLENAITAYESTANGESGPISQPRHRLGEALCQMGPRRARSVFAAGGPPTRGSKALAADKPDCNKLEREEAHALLRAADFLVQVAQDPEAKEVRRKNPRPRRSVHQP